MPYIRGVREYSFYNDEDIDHNMSVEEMRVIRLSKVPAYSPASTLVPVVEALRRLGGDVRDRSGVEPQQYFAVDEVLLSDMSVTVEHVGVLHFPLSGDTIDKLRTSSCSPQELEARDCLVVPASELKVEFKAETLNSMITAITDSLNICGGCSVKPNIRCLSVYGAGQYCGSQREVDEKAAVRLEVVLPSHCEGGQLYIKHGAQTHKCSSPTDTDSVRWIAYYTDCARGMYEVSQGHRVVLLYDVDVEYLCEPEPMLSVDVSLNNTVSQHFCHQDKLLVFLLHRYRQDTLDWRRLKGRDSTYARALLAIAKVQDLRVFLAWSTCLETWETSGYHGPVRNGGSVELHSWVDESGGKEEKRVLIDYERMAREVCTFRDEFWVLSEPDREVKLGWYGEGPAIREQWYHKACVVLLKK